MIVLAIDPGTTTSAWLLFDGAVRGHGIEPNEAVLARLYAAGADRRPDAVVLEAIESYGMAVGREVFQTVHWAGRFFEAASRHYGPIVVQVPRRTVKLHLCHSVRATDANVRAALLDRFGGSTAIGTKASPGPLYGVKSHLFSCVGLAITWQEQNTTTPISRVGTSSAE